MVLNVINHPRQLVNAVSVGALPGTPLATVYRAQLAVLVGPFIPYCYTVFVQISQLGFAVNKPQQFVHHRRKVNLLAGQQGKACGQIATQLLGKQRARANTGAVIPGGALFQNLAQQLQISLHQTCASL